MKILSMNDQKHETFIANYFREKEEEQRQELEANASIIEVFRDFALTRGVNLSSDSFSYTPITGILASSPGITSKLLDGVKTERDGLYSFKTLSSDFNFVAFPTGLLRNAYFVLLAHPHFRRGFHKNGVKS